MERKDSVPAVSQPAQRSLACEPHHKLERTDTEDTHCSFTTLFSSGIVINLDPNSTPSYAGMFGGCVSIITKAETYCWVWIRKEALVCKAD